MASNNQRGTANTGSGAKKAVRSSTGAGAAAQKGAAAAKNAAARSTPTRAAREIENDTDLMPRRKKQMWAVVLFAVALLLLAIVFIPGPALWAGVRGLVFGLFGSAAYAWPVVIIYIAVIAALDRPIASVFVKLWQAAGLIVLACSAIHVFTHTEGIPGFFEFFGELGDLAGKGMTTFSGGIIGGLIGMPFISLVGHIGARIIICLLLFIFLMFVTRTELISLFRTIWKPVEKIEKTTTEKIREREQRRTEGFQFDIPLDEPMPQHPVTASAPRSPEELSADKRRRLVELARGENPAAAKPASVEAPRLPAENPAPDLDAIIRRATGEPPKAAAPAQPAAPVQAAQDPAAAGAQTPPKAEPNTPLPFSPERAVVAEHKSYRYPPIDLFERAAPSQARYHMQSELRANAEKLVEVLRSFGVETRVVGISPGPTVTRYELQPSAGVKISKITSLADDIALNMAAAGVRIEAPIPNKAAVGIEIPNRNILTVHMRELVDSDAFRGAKSQLTVALGKDIAGNPVFADLAKMPHLLIAGATGSGKSVCINSMILSLLYKSSPDDVRLLMVDPKVVELGVYNGIPHLVAPVVTEPRKAAGALGWAVTEMLNRYKLFAQANVRDMTAYNQLARQNGMVTLPQIVIIIDELADLMMVAPNEVEDSICRLAQMARAAGMHLVIATQRPSVDVITGIIKANIPSRVAFAVSSGVDSRTILDTGGAEKLLGRGDMLFSPVGSNKPTRIQGCFVSDSEVERVVGYIKEEQENEYDQQVMEEIERQAAKEKSAPSGSGDSETDNPDAALIRQAIECVVEAGMASTSLLQRRLKLGYARAGRIIDELEARGVIGPHEGSKPRQVLITRQQWLEMTMQAEDESPAAPEQE